MVCWCETNENQKTKAIEDGAANVQQLTSNIQQASSVISEKTQQRTDTRADLRSNQNALNQATTLRTKELKAFRADEKDTLQAIQACNNSITVLSRHNTGLLELKAAARQLASARVLQLGSADLDNLKQTAFKDFLRDTQGATSFLSIPGFQSYGSQSGEIFGILNQMKDDFVDHLSEIRVEENKSVADFAALSTAKRNQIADNQRDIIDYDRRLG